MTAAGLPELRVWTALTQELRAGREAVLAAVVGHSGHAPGQCGALMAIGVSGWLAGTTGGGPAEEQVVARAQELLAGPTASLLLTQTHREGSDAPSGLLCGGEQRVALVRLPPGLRPGLESLVDALNAGDRFAWSIGPDGWTSGADGHGLVADGDRWRFCWLSGPHWRAYLVGAGHVGAALAAVLVPLGFRVTVIDERPGAAERLAGLAHATLRQPYDDLAAVVASGPDSVVLVAAHDPGREVVALASLAALEVGYLGVLGSRAKVARLGTAGGVHAPMGLPIGSHTPEEIAISVAAELLLLSTGR